MLHYIVTIIITITTKKVPLGNLSDLVKKNMKLLIHLRNKKKAQVTMLRLLYLKMFNSVYQVVAEVQTSDIWHQSLTIQKDMTKS